ncbi:MAG TPA: DUF5655 domain-containing protein [Ktedonobacterales bacterium]|nr:DUF5655 domain-containing protein [Ktedonobacterales bacterium]
MSDLKLFHMSGDRPQELIASSFAVERTLQTLIERNLDALFGVRFLASEHSTGPVHGGRIDTLGLDENNAPVIIEYKRATNENVINQGLFYLDWLVDHHGDFWQLVVNQLGQEAANAIDWRYPRLLCIAGDFTRYDEHAVQQIRRNIQLIRYRRYGDDLLLFELVNTPASQPVEEASGTASSGVPSNGRTRPASSAHSTPTSASDLLAAAGPELRDLYEALKAYLLALGDDVQFNPLRYYLAFRRIKNFACVEVHPQARHILVYVKVNPDSFTLEPGFTRDVRKIGHFGTGELEITIRNAADFERAQPLLLQSYEAS